MPMVLFFAFARRDETWKWPIDIDSKTLNGSSRKTSDQIFLQCHSKVKSPDIRECTWYVTNFRLHKKKGIGKNYLSISNDPFNMFLLQQQKKDKCRIYSSDIFSHSTICHSRTNTSLKESRWIFTIWVFSPKVFVLTHICHFLCLLSAKEKADEPTYLAEAPGCLLFMTDKCFPQQWFWVTLTVMR